MRNRILETKLIKWTDIQDLQPENVKVNINRDALKTSLKKYGFAQPFYGWENKGKVYMIDGHERKSVLSELENVPELLPCTFIDAKSKTEAVKILIEVYNQKHNPFDKEVLIEFLEVENIEISDISIEDINIQEQINTPETIEAKEDNYEIPDEIQTDIVLGDLFEIGGHRLLCGDSTDSDSVAKLMNGEKSELLFTSPPYSDMREYEGNKDLSVKNLIKFIPTFLPFVKYQVINLGIQRKNDEIIQYWDDYIEMAKNCGYKLLSWNVWDQMNATTISKQSAMFAIYHEWIFVFGKESKDLNRTWDKSEESEKRAKYYKINEKGQKVKGCRQKDGSIKNITAGLEHDYKNIGTVFSGYAEMERSIQHPAKFPILLPSEYIKAMINENDIVAEPFLGSGSTMVAAHQLNRKCYGMELEPKYCQVIVDRMRKLDPSLIIKRNGIVI